MRKPILIVCGVLGVLVGMGFVMPAVAQLRTTGALTTLSVSLLLLGLGLTGCGGGAIVLGAKRQRA